MLSRNKKNAKNTQTLDGFFDYVSDIKEILLVYLYTVGFYNCYFFIKTE